MSMDKDTQTKPEPFKPVRMHEKMWLIVFGVVVLLGFIIVIAMFAQPSPPGTAVEKAQSKNVVSTKAGANGVDASAAPIIELNTSGETANVGAGVSTAVPSGQTLPPQANEHAVAAVSGATTGNGVQYGVTGVVKHTLNTLQTTVSPLKLLP
jgi:hypothetical protein